MRKKFITHDIITLNLRSHNWYIKQLHNIEQYFLLNTATKITASSLLKSFVMIEEIPRNPHQQLYERNYITRTQCALFSSIFFSKRHRFLKHIHTYAHKYTCVAYSHALTERQEEVNQFTVRMRTKWKETVKKFLLSELRWSNAIYC